MTILAVLTTVDSRQQADAIARALVSRRLAACVQISSIDSVYFWKGKIQEDREFRLLIKTTEERYGQVEDAIRELHTYDLPAIVALPVTRAWEPFADWVTENSDARIS